MATSEAVGTSGEAGQAECPGPDGPLAYLPKLLTADVAAIGLDQLQRSDLQLLLNARGEEEVAATVGRPLASSKAKQSPNAGGASILSPIGSASDQGC